MRRKLTFTLMTMVCLAVGDLARADHLAERQGQIESLTALLDGHTRRLYYDVRKETEGDADLAPLLADSRELWRSARRLNDHAMDRVSVEKLEADVNRVEKSLDAVVQQVGELRQSREAISSIHLRVKRIRDLVHVAHDRIHDLSDEQAGLQDFGPPNARYRADASRSGNSGVHPG